VSRLRRLGRRNRPGIVGTRPHRSTPTMGSLRPAGGWSALSPPAEASDAPGRNS